jgi:Lon protease-like protein
MRRAANAQHNGNVESLKEMTREGYHRTAARLYMLLALTEAEAGDYMSAAVHLQAAAESVAWLKERQIEN